MMENIKCQISNNEPNRNGTVFDRVVGNQLPISNIKVDNDEVIKLRPRGYINSDGVRVITSYDIISDND